MGVIFYFTWAPPSSLTQEPGLGLAIYLGVMWTLLMTVYTVVAVPYFALGSEISSDSDERAGVFAFNYAGYRIGQLLAVVVPVLLMSSSTPIVTFLQTKAGLLSDSAAERALLYFSVPENPFKWSAIFFGILMIAAFLWTFLGTRERVHDRSFDGVTFARPTIKDIYTDVATTVRNKQFRLVWLAALSAEIGYGLIAALLPYVMIYWLDMEDMMPLFMVLVIFTGIPFAFMWVRVAKRIGKKAVFQIAQTIYLVTMCAFLLMTPGNLVYLVILVVFMAASLAAHSIVWPLIADIVDYEEYETNVRREGSFYGTYIFASNLASALGILVAGIMLTAIGLESGVEITSKMVNWLKISFGPGVGMWSLFGIIFISFMRYNKDEQKEIAEELEKRKQTPLA